MTLETLEKIKKEIPKTIKEFGYKTEEEFIKDALRRRVLELKKAEFFSYAKKIKEKMREKKITEEKILKDFEKFSHKE